MADSGVDTDKIARLAKMAEAARLGGKGSIRRKHAPVHKTSSAQDDKRLQQVLKRLSMNVVPGVQPCLLLLRRCNALRRILKSRVCAGIDEVNLFMDNDTVIHFSNPKVQMSNGTHTFVVSGNAGQRSPSTASSALLRVACQAILAHSPL